VEGVKKMVKLTVFGIIFMLSICYVHADPSVNSVAGSIDHGQTITISGSEFGSKNPALPLWWDDGEGAPANYRPPRTGDYSWVTSSWPTDWKHYTDVTPISISQDGGEANMKYRTAPYRNVEAPHRYSTKFLAGGHDDERECMGGEPGQAVGVTVGDSERHSIWYVRYYRTLDPLWPAAGGAMKFGVWETGANTQDGRPRMYTSQSYLSYAGGKTCPQGQSVNINMADSWWGAYGAMHLFGSNCGTGTSGSCWEQSNTFNPAPSYRNGNWEYNEQLLDYTGNFWQIKQSNIVHIDSRLDPDCVLGNPSIPAPGPRGYSFEGFWKLAMCENTQDDLDDDAWRYLDDLYVDTTFSRVMLCDSPTYPTTSNYVCEPQIPSAWSGSSITAEVNLGAITGNTAYLFVFDADNNHNAVGYQVNLDGTPAPTCAEQSFYCCPSGSSCSQPRTGTGCGGTCCANEASCSIPSEECENDNDEDGYGTGANCLGSDCDDNNANVHVTISCNYDGSECGSYDLCVLSCPQVPDEVCDNFDDDDCDGNADCDDTDCTSFPACQTGDDYRCGTACSAGNSCTNNILADSCTNSAANCDGTNDVRDIILPDSEIAGGSTINVQVEYECYQGGSGNDELALWYHNGNTWRHVRTWTEGQTLLGCDSLNDGVDGTVTAQLTVDNNPGTHYVRAIEAGVDISQDSCPSMTWGDIDDLGFTVTGGYHPADTDEDGEVDLSELVAYINSWKAGDVTLQQVMGAIVEWKG